MANSRVIVKRRKAVRNIRKITRTMQLIATARFQAALNRATATRPYADALSDLLANVAGAAGGVEHVLMTPRDAVRRTALVVITANRGLCGGYNSNVLRAACAHLDAADNAGADTDVYMVGKKGTAYFNFLERPIAHRVTTIDDTPAFDTVAALADTLMARFEHRDIDAVHVAYMRFYSAGRQRPEIIPLLPVGKDLTDKPPQAQAAGAKSAGQGATGQRATGQDATGEDRTGQGAAGGGPAGQGAAGHGGAAQGPARQGGAAQGRAGPGGAGPGGAGQGGAGQGGAGEGPAGGATGAKTALVSNFEFSPEPVALLEELVPAAVRIRLFGCFTDATVSEQIARMIAMKAATDAAEEMIKLLTRRYNRARQSQITMELLDIIGGANALE